jgi:hypothetical protein
MPFVKVLENTTPRFGIVCLVMVLENITPRFSFTTKKQYTRAKLSSTSESTHRPKNHGTLQKGSEGIEKESHGSWYLSWTPTKGGTYAKGQTVEVGKAQFSTDLKRYTILDAPDGHKELQTEYDHGGERAKLMLACW